jgi:predicted nuclease of predicted toxin-antitoxin system
MKIKLDENLPSMLAPRLAVLRHDVHTVVEEGLAGRSDPVVWQAAQREGRFLITQDLDFSDAKRLAPGTHYGILLIRLHNPSWRAIVARVTDLFAQEDVSQWAKCFVVATESKVRVRRPAKLT